MTNPVIDEVKRHGVGSVVALAGHPIHAMSVAFPIALVIATLGSDLVYWWSADPFFVRAGLWSSGSAFLFGLLAAASGLTELMLVRGIRRRAASWTHAVAAMTLLAVAGTNWGLRLTGGPEVVLPHGLLLSVLATVFVGIAGWHGGKLVFDHGIGMSLSTRD